MFQTTIIRKTGKSLDEISRAQMNLREGHEIFLPYDTYNKYTIKRICSESKDNKKPMMDDRIYYKHDSWAERSEVIPINLM
jgi:hypothetical protein